MNYKNVLATQIENLQTLNAFLVKDSKVTEACEVSRTIKELVLSMAELEKKSETGEIPNAAGFEVTDEPDGAITWDGKVAAKYVGISYWKMLDLAKRGEVPSINAGARVLFRKEALDKWIQAQELRAAQKKDMPKVATGIRPVRA